MKKKFEMVVSLTEDGKFETTVNNDGFNALEIIGFLEMKKQDVLDQINHPENFKYTRTFTNENGEKIAIEEKE